MKKYFGGDNLPLELINNSLRKGFTAYDQLRLTLNDANFNNSFFHSRLVFITKLK